MSRSEGVAKGDRRTVADEQMATFLRRPLGSARRIALNREASGGRHGARMASERAYDVETERQRRMLRSEVADVA